MPILHLTTWPGLGDEKSQQLVAALTRTLHEISGAPLDRITVYISEIPTSRWAEGGVLGCEPDFAARSRQPPAAGHLP